MLSSTHKDVSIRSASNEAIRAAAVHLQLAPVLVTDGPAARAKSAVTASYQFKEGLLRAHDRITRHKVESSLTPEAATEALNDARKVIGEYRDHVLTELARHVDAARHEATAAADPHKPRLDPSDVAQLTRTDQAWRNFILPQLEKGKNWDEIIPALDHDGLLAVKRFAPAHEAASRGRFDQHEVPSTLEGIDRQIVRRAAEAAPEGGPREALVAEQETAKFVSAASSTLGALTQLDGSKTSSEISLSVTRSTFAVGAQPTESIDGGN